MIIDLDNKNNQLIYELNHSFNYVLGDVNDDIRNNPFSKYLLYILDDRIVGYINYYLIYEKIEIANFDVLPNYQNQKIGSKLLERLISDYTGKVDNITLEVKVDNDKAVYLYQKYGFIKKAIRKGYYNGIDGILMERSMR